MGSLLDALKEANRSAPLSIWRAPMEVEALLGPSFVPKNATKHGPGEAAVDKPKNWKKPKDMPRRPLSAYNLFFKSERLSIVTSISDGPNSPLGRNGKTVGIGFAGLARDIASKWKTLDSSEKSVFEEQAKIEKLRYHKEISVWRSIQPPKQKSKKQVADASLAPTKSTSAVVENLGRSAFDASDDTSQSLHDIMHDALRLASHFGKCQVPQWDRIQTMNLSEPDPVMSTAFLVSDVGNSFHPSSGPPVIKALPYDCFPSSCEEDSLWRGLAYCETFGSHQHVNHSVDELTNFMETMEKDDF